MSRYYFKEFSAAFVSDAIKRATQADFTKSRELDLSGFPTVIYRQKDKLYFIATGFTEFEVMKKSILKLKSKKS